MSDRHYLACDLGAESGRVILGTLCDGRLSLEEIHRFATGADEVDGTWRWNVPRILGELQEGLRLAAATGADVASVSVDSWGVDYVLYSDQEPMLALPYQYRDSRTDNVYPAVREKAGEELIFGETGIQFMAINTLYQLIAEVNEHPDLVEAADGFLPIADYFNYRFSGVARSEVSLASTTQAYNPSTRTWSKRLITEFGLPESIFPEVVDSGTVLGPLTGTVAAETGLAGTRVIATCSHDTGSAVAAVPATGDDWAYLSSGTWSLIGVELPSPMITDAALRHGFTNEVGFGGTTRFLKNIVGLWLLQESRRVWASQGNDLDYAEITRLAAEAEPFRSLVNPNDPRFLKPGDMPAQIAAACRESGEPAPETPGQFARCITESLALLYARTLDSLEEVTGRSISTLHIVGGGSQSDQLNQFAANASGRRVLTGPVEATAIGNLLIQAVALGDLGTIDELREVVRNSFPIHAFEPADAAEWQQAAERFQTLTQTIVTS